MKRDGYYIRVSSCKSKTGTPSSPFCLCLSRKEELKHPEHTDVSTTEEHVRTHVVKPNQICSNSLIYSLFAMTTAWMLHLASAFNLPFSHSTMKSNLERFSTGPEGVSMRCWAAFPRPTTHKSSQVSLQVGFTKSVDFGCQVIKHDTPWIRRH